MTQQEKRPVHCETCYSLSYSVTAPLPAARRCGHLSRRPPATHSLAAPRAQGQHKVVGHTPRRGPFCITAHLPTAHRVIQTPEEFPRRRATTMVGLNVALWLLTPAPSQLSLCPATCSMDTEDTVCRTAWMEDATSALPLLGMSKQKVSQLVIFTVFSNRTATSFPLCRSIKAQPRGFTCKGTVSS